MQYIAWLVWIFHHQYLKRQTFVVYINDRIMLLHKLNTCFMFILKGNHDFDDLSRCYPGIINVNYTLWPSSNPWFYIPASFRRLPMADLGLSTRRHFVLPHVFRNRVRIAAWLIAIYAWGRAVLQLLKVIFNGVNFRGLFTLRRSSDAVRLPSEKVTIFDFADYFILQASVTSNINKNRVLFESFVFWITRTSG